MKKKIVLFCIVFIIGAYLLYQYIYKEHRDISTEKASFVISVVELKKEYNENDSLANVKYLDKTIQIHGSITNIDLSNNYFSFSPKYLEIFQKLPNLACLYLRNKPLSRETPNYRKSYISHIPNLKYLDDRPIQP